MARTSLGPRKSVLDMGSSSHWGLIIAPGQEANRYVMDAFSIFYKIITYWEFPLESFRWSESTWFLWVQTKYIFMIKWDKKNKKNIKLQLKFVFLSYRKNFLGNRNRVRITKVNKLSVFESLMFYCIFMMITGEFRTKQTRLKQGWLFSGLLPERFRGIPCVLQYWKTQIMTLTMLWANWADDKLMLFFVFFLKN